MGKREPSDFAFLDHLDELLDDLHHNVPKALKEFDTDGIHDARVATRRLKAALDLLDPVLSDRRKKPFAKVLRKLRRRLGPLRDADVMIEHLGELTPAGQTGPAAQWLRAHLLAERQRAQEESRQHKEGSADVLERLGSWWGVREEIEEARDAIDSLLAESLHLQTDAFAERADQLTSASGSSADPSAPRQDPHQLRIAGKLLRYTLELAAAHGHKLPGSVTKTFKQMQEALGNWHDYVVLVECAMRTSLGEQLAYHDLARQDQLVELTKQLLKRATRELDGFSRLWRQEGAQVTETVRQTFPLTRPVAEPVEVEPELGDADAIESKTDPDPTGSDGTPPPPEPTPDAASNA